MNHQQFSMRAASSLPQASSRWLITVSIVLTLVQSACSDGSSSAGDDNGNADGGNPSSGSGGGTDGGAGNGSSPVTPDKFVLDPLEASSTTTPLNATLRVTPAGIAFISSDSFSKSGNLSADVDPTILTLVSTISGYAAPVTACVGSQQTLELPATASNSDIVLTFSLAHSEILADGVYAEELRVGFGAEPVEHMSIPVLRRYFSVDNNQLIPATEAEFQASGTPGMGSSSDGSQTLGFSSIGECAIN